MTKQLLALAGLVVPLVSHAATITSDEGAGNPLATGAIYTFAETIGADQSFAHSVHFSTDANAGQGSGAVIGLELDGVSDFEDAFGEDRPFRISLFQDNYVTGESTSVATRVAWTTGNSLNNVAVDTNAQYSFVIEGVTGESAPNNTFSGLVSISQVPVPAAAWLFGSAVLGLAGYARKRS